MQLKFELFDDLILLSAVQPNNPNALRLATASVRNAVKLWNYSDTIETEVPNLTMLAELSGHDKQIGNLVWSPDGKFLLSTCDFALLWEITEPPSNNRFKKFPPEGGEIHTAVWSPSSTRFVLGYFSDILALHDITDGSIAKKKLEYSARAICWDPLDRYIAILSFDNHLYLRKVPELDVVFKKVSLNLKCKKFKENLTKRTERKIAWSPDCAYIVCPSYEDAEIPIACVLSRKKDFELEACLAGPSSSISCIAFQDMIYRDETNKSEYCIFAMGDSEGNISIWRTNKAGGAMKYIKGGSEEVSIESLSWSHDGGYLFASTTRRFVIAMKFKPGYFGTPLLKGERNEFLVDSYGTSEGGSNLAEKGLTFLDLRMKASAKNNPPSGIPGLSISGATAGNIPSSQGASIQSQTQVTNKLQMEKTKDGKKKYIPVNKITPSQNISNTPLGSQLLASSQTVQQVASEMPLEPSNIANTDNKMVEELNKSLVTREANEETMKPKKVRSTLPNQIVEKTPMLQQIFFDKPTPIEKFHQIRLKNCSLEIDVKKSLLDPSEETITTVRCVGISVKNVKHILWTDFVDGKVLLYHTNSKILCYYTDAHLLFTNSLSNGRKYELPIVVPNLVMIKLNERNDIILIKNDGELRVYNIDSKEVLLEQNIGAMVKALSGTFRCSVENIHIDEEGTPYLCVRPNLVIFYNKKEKGWQKVDQHILGLGIFKNVIPFEKKNDIIHKPQTNRERFHDFMTRICPDTVKLEELSMEKKASVICKLEEGLLYAMTIKDVTAYFKTADIYIVKLAQFGEYNKIRQFLIEDLCKRENGKDHKFLKENRINISEKITHYKDIMAGLAIGGNRELLNIIQEIETLANSVDFIYTDGLKNL